jgi:hypothetical protein
MVQAILTDLFRRIHILTSLPLKATFRLFMKIGSLCCVVIINAGLLIEGYEYDTSDLIFIKFDGSLEVIFYLVYYVIYKFLSSFLLYFVILFIYLFGDVSLCTFF